MRQTWNDLLFAHWRIPANVMRRLVPSVLPLDLWGGWAWITVVPFWMSDVRPRFLPSVPWLSTFAELNVRTYVTLDGKPGVFFFSLDAANPLAVEVARAVFRLPYFDAAMRTWRDHRAVRYASRRTDRRGADARLKAVYRPTGPVFHATPGSFAYWLTERYCLYAITAAEVVFRSEIQHPPWPLQTADALFTLNTLFAWLDVQMPDERPVLHFARRQDMVAWAPERVR